jgi:hypothetical protein
MSVQIFRSGLPAAPSIRRVRRATLAIMQVVFSVGYCGLAINGTEIAMLSAE